MFCKDCKYWDREHKGIYGEENYAECTNEHIVYYQAVPDNMDFKTETGCLIYCDNEIYAAWAKTGADFGCIYWKSIPEVVPELCEICNKNKQTGSVGKLDDPKFKQYVCSDCYYNVLKMRSVLDIFNSGDSIFKDFL